MFDDSGCPPEADLCQELRVSRGSLREAVRMLAAPGVVEPRHGSGTHVSPLRPEDLIGSLSLTPQLRPLPGLLELYEIRRVLEAHVAAQAAARAGAAGATKPPAMTPPCPPPAQGARAGGQPDVRAAGDRAVGLHRPRPHGHPHPPGRNATAAQGRRYPHRPRARYRAPRAG